MTLSWSWTPSPEPKPFKFYGVVRIVGTIGHCIGPDGKRVAVPPMVQAMMNRTASSFSRSIRHLN